MPFTRRTLRFAPDLRAPEVIWTDLVSSSPAMVFRGTDNRLEFAILDGAVPIDASQLASVTLEIRRLTTAASTLLFTQTQPIADAVFDYEQFTSGQKTHASFDLTALDTNFALTLKASSRIELLFAVFTGLASDGKKTTLGTSVFKWTEEYAGGADVPPDPVDAYLTAAETNSLLNSRIPLAQKGAANGVATLDADSQLVQLDASLTEKPVAEEIDAETDYVFGSVGGQVKRIAPYAMPISAAQAAVVATALSTKAEYLSPLTLIWEGDSVTAGYVASNLEVTSFRALVVAAHPGCGNYQFAVAGSRLATLVDRYAANVYPLRPAVTGRPNTWLSVFIGLNDLGNPTDPETWYESLKAYWAQARADGFRVLAYTVYQRQPRIVADDYIRMEGNRLIRSDMRLYDALVDTDLLFPGSVNEIMTAGDHLHLADLGHAHLARAVNAELAIPTIRSPEISADIYPSPVITGVIPPSTPKTITSISTGTIPAITCANHGFVTGQWVILSGTNSTPVLDVPCLVTVIDSNHFTVPHGPVTVAGTAGTANGSTWLLDNFLVTLPHIHRIYDILADTEAYGGPSEAFTGAFLTHYQNSNYFFLKSLGLANYFGEVATMLLGGVADRDPATGQIYVLLTNNSTTRPVNVRAKLRMI